ncbi:MAG: DNA-binding response regulator [Candidatus Yanofskybacteria bacterium CG10_big_fil_rev_8_21_14_0_10_36_16]|uniref:DNA-binding response regulator n=1 Tax=Candidatus Yanofskybacteria bacterium CG10_big_fil_rev_8_21_14_0_10_36_16 TaxID=1975096 RepID=A0A2J0Q7Y9_9BACT|nr:MAG: DNA-binding response regulator [Candidatus Yanofskybacteria bacterium CG10_big_fil_rev_8_21_14_0_10_36_16]
MRILIVEDEIKLAKALKKILEKEGFAADFVTDGEEAEKRILLFRKEYDLIILDLMLPKKSGFEICQNIRNEGVYIPVLVLTARGSIEDKIEVLDSGADDYMVKPFSFEELLARVRAILRRPDEALPEKLKLGNLTLSPSTRQVFYNSHEIHLTLKEYSLLEYMMRHPNQVLNREQILDHVWDFNFDSFSNVIDVHIKNLRKKIRYGKNNPSLETIRGVGYRLRE